MSLKDLKRLVLLQAIVISFVASGCNHSIDHRCRTDDRQAEPANP